MTTDPTPLDDFEEITTGMMSLAAEDRLRAFLQSPAVQALSDPKLRAAAEVVIGKLPRLMEMEAKATPGPWFTQEEGDDGYLGVMSTEPANNPKFVKDVHQITLDYVVSEGDAALIVAARNALHEAAQAAKDRQVYDQSHKGEAKHE